MQNTRWSPLHIFRRPVVAAAARRSASQAAAVVERAVVIAASKLERAVVALKGFSLVLYPSATGRSNGPLDRYHWLWKSTWSTGADFSALWMKVIVLVAAAWLTFLNKTHSTYHHYYRKHNEYSINDTHIVGAGILNRYSINDTNVVMSKMLI